MDPQQELFSSLRVVLESKYPGIVFDGFLPPDGTPYPFIYLGDSQQSDEATKTVLFGRIHQSIHVYSNTPRNRGTVSGILLSIKDSCRALSKTSNFNIKVANINQRILPDNTTKQPLLHGVLEVEFTFS